MSATDPSTAAGRAATVLDWQRAQVRVLGRAMLVLSLLLPVALYAYAWAVDQAYWKMFRGELNLASWFSSLQMLLIAVVASLNHAAAGMAARLGIADRPRHAWMWLVLALGFVILGIDERFGIHEALRDDVFRPSGIAFPGTWVIRGDLGLYLFLLIGLACTPLLYDDLRRPRAALVLFIAAIALAVPAIVIDSLRDEAMDGWPYRLFWDYVFEEVGEIWAELLFLLSFLVVLHRRLGALRAHVEGD